MVLNTPIAAEASVVVVTAFIKLREILLQSKDLAKRLNELESKYDRQFSVVFETIKKLMQLPSKDSRRRKRIGYRRQGEKEDD